MGLRDVREEGKNVVDGELFNFNPIKNVIGWRFKRKLLLLTLMPLERG